MRHIFLSLLIIAPLFAIGEKTVTMQAEFVQTITDEKNSTITYTGNMLAKRPNMTMWHYMKPVEKTVYITSANVTIVEPELEQAIVKKLDNSIDILAILAAAKKNSRERYTAYYNHQQYHISMQGDMIKSISYSDAFDNIVTIVFTAQQINKDIDDSRFHADIPEEFDIIRN